MKRLLTALCGGLLLFASSAFAATVTVSTSDALWAAVRAGVPGDVVQVANGVYPTLSLYSNTDYPLFVKAAPGVTVTPAPGAKVTIAGLSIDGAQGLTFRGLDIPLTPTQQNGVIVANSARIVLDGLTIHQADGSRQGLGVSVRNSTEVALTHSELHHLGVGMGHGEGNGLTVTDNSFHDLESDGVIGSSDNVLIARNRFKSFYPGPGEHPDAIQLWGKANYGGPIKNVTITDNIIERGDGYGVDAAGLKLTGFQGDGTTPAATMPPQGIFLEDVDTVLVQGNAMAGTMYNGIGLARGAHVRIVGNFVMGYADMGARIITRGQSSDVTVQDNTVSQPIVALDGEGPYPNYVESGTVTLPPAAVGDTSSLTTWLAAKGGAVTPVPVPTPDPTPTPVPPVPPPVVTPPVVPDSRDEQISSLTAQLAALTATANASASQVTALTTQVATLTKAATDNATLLSTANGKVTTLTAQVASLTAQVNASSVTTLKAQIASLNKKISNAQSALK